MPAHVIEVTPAQKPNGIEWTLCYKNTNICGGPGNYPAVDLGQNTGPQVIIFNINDPAKLGIKFDPTDPIWIQANNKPTGPVVGPPSQVVDVTPANNTTLVFMDKNKGPAMTLKYQLNFVGADNQKVTAIDPDIRNGGGTGGRKLFGAAEASALLIGAAVGITVATLWFRRAAAKRNTAS